MSLKLACTKDEVAELRRQLVDVKFLAAKFKESDMFFDMEDEAMSSGVSWSFNVIRTQHPDWDVTLQEKT